MKITFVDEKDYIAKYINAIGFSTPRTVLAESVLAIIPKEERVAVMRKQEATQYFVKKNEAIIVDVPELSKDKSIAVTQLAVAVGRRLERFERGQKANVGRDAISRQKIAQNAIQARWGAK